MKVLVTGGAGFIGSHLSRELLQSGHTVLVLDNLAGGRKENIADLLERKEFTFHQVDICNSKQLQTIFLGVDWVFHLAGIADIVPSIEQPEDYYATNVTGTLNVLQAARNADVSRFVYAASSSCYGIPDTYPTSESAEARPQYPYALTKYMGEQLVMHWAKVYKMPAVSLRLFNVFGPNSRTTGAYGAVFGVFLAQKINGEAFTVVGDGEQTRDFTYVSDVVSAFIAAADSNVSNEIMNVGSGDTYSVNQLVSLLGGEVTYIPKRPGEPNCTFANTDKIRDTLNWKPKVSFSEGVGSMLEHIECWRNAPVWTEEGISDATRSWFKFLDE